MSNVRTSSGMFLMKRQVFLRLPDLHQERDSGLMLQNTKIEVQHVQKMSDEFFSIVIPTDSLNRIATIDKTGLRKMRITPLSMQDAIVARIEQRIAAWTFLPEGNSYEFLFLLTDRFLLTFSFLKKFST